MKLAVVSHKRCWAKEGSPSGYATDGGFPFQIAALSELFSATRVVVPCSNGGDGLTGADLIGQNLSVAPLTPLQGGTRRRLLFAVWFVRNARTLIAEIRKADAVHAPIPGDVGTIGILLAFTLRKPLLVRHCGNWFVQRSAAERFWRWLMERIAGGKNVMLATGGATEPPSKKNPNVRWIFSTSLTERELLECQRNVSFPGPSPRLIIIARQELGKGIELLIESLPLILKEFGGTTLDVVGYGEALPQFKELAQSLGLQERVTFHGKVNHKTVMSLLKRSDLFCFPTSSEGFPKVVLEALACGLPVVTTRVSVLPQLINGCGVLMDDNSPQSIADAVKDCLVDRARYQAMSVKAFQTARRYSLEQWRDTIGSLLSGVWGPLKASS